MAAHYDNQKVALLLLEKGASPHATAKVSARLRECLAAGAARPAAISSPEAGRGRDTGGRQRFGRGPRCGGSSARWKEMKSSPGRGGCGGALEAVAAVSGRVAEPCEVPLAGSWPWLDDHPT